MAFCGLLQATEQALPDWMVDFHQTRENFETNVLKDLKYSTFGVSAQPLYAYLFYRFNEKNNEIFTPITVPAGIIASEKIITDPLEAVVYWLKKNHCSVQAKKPILDISGSSSAITAKKYLANDILDNLKSDYNKNIYLNYVALQIHKDVNFTAPEKITKIEMPTKEKFLEAFDWDNIDTTQLSREKLSATLFKDVLKGEKKEEESKLGFSVIEPTESVIKVTKKEKIGEIHTRTWQTPFGKTSEDTFELCNQEKIYLETRKPLALKALNTFFELDKLNIENTKLLRIAVCGSGGGFRAMYSISGAFETLEKSGLLDTALYVVGLSGSTWTIGSWIYSGVKFNQFITDFIQRINNNKKTFSTWNPKNLLKKAGAAVWGGTIDTYAPALEDVLSIYSLKGANPTLSSLAEKVKDGKLPFPVLTAVLSPTYFQSRVDFITYYMWCDITPYEVACYRLLTAVTADAFGNTFDKGSITTNPIARPLPLSKILAICGSAFAFTKGDLTNIPEPDGYLKPIPTVDQSWSKLYLDSIRPLGYEANNIAFGIKETQFSKVPKFAMVDAGLSFNLPLPPLCQRDALEPLDLMVVIDSSGDLPKSFELEKAAAYAEANGLRFPDIKNQKYKNFKTQPYTLFGIDEKDKNNDKMPLILYVPIANNSIYFDIIQEFTLCWTAAFGSKDQPIFKDAKSYSNVLNASIANPTNAELKKHCEKLSDLLNIIIEAKGFQLSPTKIQDAITFVQKMLKYDFSQKIPDFMGTFQFDYTLDQVDVVRSIFMVAIQQAIPEIKKELLKRLPKKVRLEREKLMQEALEKEKQQLEKEQKEQNVIFEDLAQAFNVIAD